MTDKAEASAEETPFRWRNCRADIEAWRHSITVELYLNDVVLPALETIATKAVRVGQSDIPGAPFAQGDLEMVLTEAKLAFGLSIQSIWERQFRAYLKTCARELRPDAGLEDKLEKASWSELTARFGTLRGIRLEAFPSYPALDPLHHLGNACRHGDGDSAKQLARRCPDLWRTYPPMSDVFGAIDPPAKTVALIDLPVARLQEFVAAVAAFWRDAGYIYNESLESKSEHLERHLEQERRERMWRPTAALAITARR